MFESWCHAPACASVAAFENSLVVRVHRGLAVNADIALDTGLERSATNIATKKKLKKPRCIKRMSQQGDHVSGRASLFFVLGETVRT